MKATTLAALAVLLPAALASAESLNAKLGLWESTVNTEIGGRNAMANMPQIPPEALAKMPPQQRAQVEAMMKARSGGGITTKVCMTQDSFNSGAFAQRDKSCTTKIVSSSATKQVVHVDCDREGMKSSGDMTVEAVNPQLLKGTMVMKTNAGGQTTDMKMSFENKWISADCGSVKPSVPR